MNDEDDSWLDKHLRAEDPHIDNEGFSRRVVNALPKPRKWSWAAKRRVIRGLSAFVGLLGFGIIVEFAAIERLFLQALNHPAWLSLSLIGVFVGIAMSCVWVVYHKV